MTAPDSGLTDLIAAHQAGERWTDFQYPSIFSDEPCVATTTKMVNCSCGDSMPADDHPAHVALVMEQHTNRQITNLREEVERQKALINWFDGLATSSEKTIARVHALKVDLFRRGGFIITKWEAARLVRAALEGD